MQGFFILSHIQTHSSNLLTIIRANTSNLGQFIMDNRRQYTRVLFSTPATLLVNEQHQACELLDVSLNGVLISHPNGIKADKHQSAELNFTLPGSNINIMMAVEISHIEPLHIGLHCTHIDIDSITHLKRLVELNLGNDALLHRELAMLIHTPE